MRGTGRWRWRRRGQRRLRLVRTVHPVRPLQPVRCRPRSVRPLRTVQPAHAVRPRPIHSDRPIHSGLLGIVTGRFGSSVFFGLPVLSSLSGLAAFSRLPVLSGLSVEPREVTCRLSAQRRVRTRRQRQETTHPRLEPTLRRRRALALRAFRHPCPHRTRRTGSHPSLARYPVTLHNHVRVRPREPERAHSRAHRATHLRPRRRLRRHPQRQPLPVHPRTRRLEVQMPRDHPVVHRQRGLDQARHPRRGLQMTNVRLHRTDQERPFGRPAPPVRRRRRVRLHRVAQLCPRPVRLQVVHLRGLQSRARQRLPDHPLLRRTARHRQPRARSVLVHRRATHHRPDPVPRRLRVRQTLQHHHRAALATHEPVRRRVERLAPPVRRQNPGTREDFGAYRRQNHVHPTREREIALAALEAHHRLVQRHQRRRAGGVHRDRRTFQTQRERHPPDRRAVAVAGDGVEVGELSGTCGENVPVVVGADPGEHAGAAALQPLGIDPRLLQRLPTRLQQQTLLGVQGSRLHRRDPEERRIELIDVVEIASPPTRARRIGGRRPGFIIRASLSLGYRRHRIPACLELLPECREVRTARESARHPHDRDRLSELRDLAFATVQLRIQPLREIEVLPLFAHSCSPSPSITSSKSHGGAGALFHDVTS